MREIILNDLEGYFLANEVVYRVSANTLFCLGEETRLDVIP